MAMIGTWTGESQLLNDLLLQFKEELRRELKAQFQAMADDLVQSAVERAMRQVAGQVTASQSLADLMGVFNLRVNLTLKVD